MTAAEGIRLAGLHPATLPLVMLPLIRARVAHQSCRQPCGQLPFPRVFPSHSQQTNCCGRTAQPSYSLTPRLNPHSLRHSRRTTRHRDFVLWRFLAAGRQSAWSDHRCRQPKTCTKHKSTHYRSATPASGSPQTADVTSRGSYELPQLRGTSLNKSGPRNQFTPASLSLPLSGRFIWSIAQSLGPNRAARSTLFACSCTQHR